jgi:two-component system, chemotaxis family, protein-glutamate methylesterase/glutaminase
MSNNIKYIIVVGASAGGFRALSELASKIPNRTDIAVFVVLHVSKNSVGKVLETHLQKHTSLICNVAADGTAIQGGHIYIAPPDHHMVMSKDLIRIIKGPEENRWRPSIDVLFRSAAAHYNVQTIGIILTGLLDDGTSGMAAIKRCGGITIVQEPGEAEFADMPESVLRNVEVDYRVPIADMGYVLDDIFSKEIIKVNTIPEEIRIEADITEKMISDIDEMEKIGKRSQYSCPDCGGGLWSVKNEPVKRFRCFTGHVYYETTLLGKQKQALEESLWEAIRILEERKALLQSSTDRQEDLSDVQRHEIKNAVTLTEQYIKKIKSILESIAFNELGNTSKS